MDILSQLLGLFQEMAIAVLIVTFNYALQFVALAASLGILTWIYSQTAGKKGLTLKDTRGEITGIFMGSLPRFLFGFLVPWLLLLHFTHNGEVMGTTVNMITATVITFFMGLPVSVGSAQKEWRWMQELSTIAFFAGSALLWAVPVRALLA